MGPAETPQMEHKTVGMAVYYPRRLGRGGSWMEILKGLVVNASQRGLKEKGTASRLSGSVEKQLKVPDMHCLLLQMP